MVQRSKERETMQARAEEARRTEKPDLRQKQ